MAAQPLVLGRVVFGTMRSATRAVSTMIAEAAPGADLQGKAAEIARALLECHSRVDQQTARGVASLQRALVDPAVAEGGNGCHASRSGVEGTSSARRPPDPPDVEHGLDTPAPDALRRLPAEALVKAEGYAVGFVRRQ